MSKTGSPFGELNEVPDDQIGLGQKAAPYNPAPAPRHTTYTAWLDDPEHQRLRLRCEKAELRYQWVANLLRYGGDVYLQPFAERMAKNDESNERAALLRWYRANPNPADDDDPS